MYGSNGELIGGCDCGCPFSPQQCAHPSIWDEESCSCECRHTQSCPAHQIFDASVCRCVCANVGSPGGPCVGNNGQMLADSTVNSDCSCSCPSWSATASDCAATGRVLKQCECTCPDLTCPGAQNVNKGSCKCECPLCADDHMLTDAYNCLCAPRYVQYIWHC